MIKQLTIVLLVVGLAACEDETTFVAGSLSQPVDFAFACEGQERTVAPQDDQSAALYESTRMCADVTHGSTTSQGDLLGLVLNQSPATVHVVQMNPASGNDVRVVDASRFVPGYTGLQVGEAPIRILRDSNYGAFYVLNAGSNDFTRIVLRSFNGELDAAQTTFGLPGTPADGIVIDGKLLITNAFKSELWILDTEALDQEPQIVPLPDRVHSIVALDATTVAMTWKKRPMLSLLDSSGLLDVDGEQPLVPACRDTLDNDGDGKADHEDGGCSDGHDTSENSESDEASDLEQLEPLNAFVSGLFCDDGIDNDGDGLVDGQDPSCDANGTGERVPECADGIDNDGDGTIDLEDASCYGKNGTKEGHVYGDGPFHAAVVNSVEAGRFVYVLDQSRAEILVFARTDEGLSRVDVNASGPALSELVYRSYGGQSSEALPGLTNPGYPALSHLHQKNIELPSTNLTSLTGFHGVGEIWDRGFEPEEGEAVASVPEGLSSSTHWIPSGCDPNDDSVCRQPQGDGDNHFVVGSRLDGSLQMIQAVYRGVPWHKFVQLANDPALRTISISAPKLSLAGSSIPVGSATPEDHPFMGSMSTETVQTALAGVQHGLKRQYGISPPADPEQAPDEAWALTYQGVIPKTEGMGGRLLEESLFYGPGQYFCSHGVEAGDWLVLESASQNMSEALHYPIALTFEGEPCPLVETHTSKVQVQIVSVKEDILQLDPATAQTIPQTPVLEETTLSLSRLKGCRELLEQAVEDLGLASGELSMKDTSDFAPGNLPDRLAYKVRAGSWIAEGTRSGFSHRNVFAEGACSVDPNLTERLNSRLQEAKLAGGSYETCPPENSLLTSEGLESLVENGSGFENHSFKVTMLPACRNTTEGIVLPGTRRDTRWSFSLNGTDTPTTISVEGTTHSARSVPFNFRRQLIHLGTSGNRVTVLRVSPTTTVPISKFE